MYVCMYTSKQNSIAPIRSFEANRKYSSALGVSYLVHRECHICNPSRELIATGGLPPALSSSVVGGIRARSVAMKGLGGGRWYSPSRYSIPTMYVCMYYANIKLEHMDTLYVCIYESMYVYKYACIYKHMYYKHMYVCMYI